MVYGDMDFPAKLALLIAQRNTSQSRLSRDTGLSQSAISLMTKGEQRPYLDQGLRLARALRVSLDFLADDDLDQPPRPELTDDERVIVSVVRAAGLSSDAAIRALWRARDDPPGELTPGRVIAEQELSASTRAREAEQGRPAPSPPKPEPKPDPKRKPK